MHDPMNEREMEAFWENAVPELPPNEIVREVTPWKKAMRRILIGLAMTTLLLNFWGLDTVLPAVSLIYLLLGFRTLRRENPWFRRCYWIAVLLCVGFYPSLVFEATIWHQPFYDSGWGIWLTAGSLILQFSLFFCLWRGIKAVQRKAGLPEHAGGAVGLMVWFAVICLLSLIGTVDIVTASIIVIVYICALRSLWKVAGELEEGGYLIEAAPIRLPDWAVGGIIVGVTAVGLTLAYLFGGTYPMEWTPREGIRNDEVAEIKTHLASLGFPEDILDDMTDEDVLDCRGARRVVVSVRDHPFNEGRVVSRYVDSIYKLRKPGIERTTVYDVKELRITGIGVRLAGEREQWKIIHHFRWTADPGYFGTESIQLWPAYRDSKGWGDSGGDVTGRLLYDKDGVTYTGEYVSLGKETFTTNSIFWGESTSTDVFAEFSLPHDGENQRGYLAYTVFEKLDGYLVDAWINYTHQQTWLQYPVLTAKQQRMANAWNDAGAFLTVQDALQFRPEEQEGES